MNELIAKNNPVYVTQPFMPPLSEFNVYLEKIWRSKKLTNNGEFHKQLEQILCEYLGVKYISLFANGTLALITALQTLGIKGEVITTPYSFVATTHALWWNNIKPVFCDIDPDSFNLDPDKIEKAITSKTTAILPVHVYGNPCNVEKIQKIADSYKLKVIYDAAHAFGVKQKGNSILNYGDLSILSFHATKVFHTFEGGAIISHDEETKKRIDHLKNFGFVSEISVIEPGINAKMNEVQAAMGLLQLKYIDKNIEQRKTVFDLYTKELKNINGIKLNEIYDGISYNYGYFPIFVDENKFGMSRDALFEKLKENNIFVRRYFYPLISNFPKYKELNSAKKTNLSIANKLADQVICLPIYTDLEFEYINKICSIIKTN